MSPQAASLWKHVRPLCKVDVSDLVAWITAIPFEEWPQQHRLNGELRPAMVNDLEWHGFGDRTDRLVFELRAHMALLSAPEAYNRMLSVVMPGHHIDRHRDAQPPEWITRVHVPLTTPTPCPDGANITVWDSPTHGTGFELEVGTAYLVDTREEHSVHNYGETPRIHFMFDVRRTP
jgi:hypothetical protein